MYFLCGCLPLVSSDLLIGLRAQTQYFSLLLTSREGRYVYDYGETDANLNHANYD